MSISQATRIAGAGAAIATLVLLPAGQASASCAAEVDLTAAEVPFVGEVVAVDGPYTRFRVEGQAAAGPPLALRVWVLTGQPSQGWIDRLSGVQVSGSEDLVVTVGDRFALGARRGREALSADVCSSVSLREGEPAPDALLERGPVADGLAGQPPPSSPWLVAGPIAVVALGGTAVVLRRRRPAGAA